MQNKFIKLFTLSAVLALMTACTTSTTKNQHDPLAELVGKNIEQAKTALGKPNNVYDMQNGTLEYIWSKSSGAASSSGFMGVQIATGLPKGCNRVLIVSESKVVVGYRYEGKC